MKFEKYKISDEIKKNLVQLGFKRPTDIQFKAIPSIMQGEDVLAIAQTGTGKTAAFAIPILQHLYHERRGKSDSRKIRSLVITPTRELAIQIAESFTLYGKYTGIRNTVIF
ncbi:MAG: DEAD/DEAH box helicase, partial [Calditrichia bacterium]|nr:DEAD/DEAH box helicase [Calditrichia bacterium]